MCNYDGGDCCEPENVGDGFCDIGNLNRMCDFDGELNDCSCDYENLTRDGFCNSANNKSNCLFDDYDCLCQNSKLVNGFFTNCKGKQMMCKRIIFFPENYLQMLTVLPPPLRMELILDGHVREKHSKYQGNYSLVKDAFVNGYPYWVQQSGLNALWFGMHRGWMGWMIGEVRHGDLGSTFGGISAHFGIDKWPTQMIGGFDYWNGSTWSLASSSDLKFKDCKTL